MSVSSGDEENEEENSVRSEEDGGDSEPGRPLFEEDDARDVENLSNGVKSVLGSVMTCAETALGRMLAPQQRKRRNRCLKEFHRSSFSVVESRLKVELSPRVVDRVYESLDLETLANSESSDDAFFDLLHEFEKKVDEEMGGEWESVTLEIVDADQDYQSCLETLNKFHKRKRKKKKKPVSPPPTPPSPPPSPQDEVYYQGLATLKEEIPEIPTKDPLTRVHFEDPYVNKVCRHVYEFNSVYRLICAGESRCPYAGCSHPLNALDLIKDEQLEKDIRRQISLEELD